MICVVGGKGLLLILIKYTMLLLSLSTPSLLRNHRYRRDPRTLEEEEETWFDEDDETEDMDSVIPISDVLRSSLDADFDQINRFIGSRKGNID